ncbi:MAG: transcriptional repressor [Chloroflexi bacterium]|nr:transcriptional repressor [Chloroflexota bacterium]
MVDSAPLLTALDRAGYRLTDARRAVVQLIVDQPRHFSAAELFAAARAQRTGIGRATVFRTLEVLSELGQVERLDLPSGKHAYIACEPSHHHHVICSRCGRTAEVADAGLRRLVRDVVRQTGFRVDDHRLELFGLCSACVASTSVPIDRPI